MRPTAIIAAVASLALLPACTEETEPSPMPTSEDALTTATEEPEDEAATSEPEETTEEPTTEEPDAKGPPEMPAEAEEQTEEGAVAFARHYVETLNYAMSNPRAGIVEPLALDNCATCDNFEELVAYGETEGEYLAEPMAEIGELTSIFTEDGARVVVPAVQMAQPFLKDGQPVERKLEREELSLVIRVSWQDEWLVESITVES